MDKLKEIIRKKLKEVSATGQGGASFTAGQGESYATPAAFASKTNSKGTKNIYYYKLGFKPVPDKIKGSGLEVKQLWEEDILNEVNEFQQKRLDGIDEIEKLLNEISPLVSNAKNETIELYSGNAGSYDITQPIEIVLSYLKEVKQLLTEK
jgi:PHP family Zn ribbon phosphoesterase